MVLTSENVTLIALLITLLSNAVGWCAKTIYEKRKSEKIEQEALKILLRQNLTLQHETYCEKGEITRIELAEFEYSLNVYDRLIGTNGYVQDLTDDIRNLKVR